LEKCRELLGKGGVTPIELFLAVVAQVPWDGTKSTTTAREAGTLDPQGPHYADESRYADLPMSSFFGPQINARAQLGGVNAWFNPTTPESVRVSAVTITHEALHNLTGMGDERLATALGYTGDLESASQWISQALKDCVK
jgi:hypothetical protein